jgi:uncharacterized Zn finger protein
MFIVNKNARLNEAKRRALESRPAVGIATLGRYCVEGSKGDLYAVTVTRFGHRTGVDCTCTAGQYGNECYHAAAALALHDQLIASGEPTPAAARSKHLGDIERALRTVERAADRMTGDFEAMDAIFKAVRDARLSLEDFELETQPATADAVAA